LEIVIPILVSVLLFGIISIPTGNIAIGLSIFTAALVITNYIFSRYDARTDSSLELKFLEDEDGHFFEVSIANTGGKTIYLDQRGIKTKEGITVDFYEEPKREIPKPNKSNPFSPYFEMPLLRMPKIKPINANTVEPGSANVTRMTVKELLFLLDEKDAIHGESIELKGFYTNQLGEEFGTDEWKDFSIESLFKMAIEEMNK
jgi:hypothetical protein